MAPNNNNNDLLSVLLIFMLLGDDPASHELLPYLEREFGRLLERNPSLRRLPFPPSFLLRRLIDRRSSSSRWQADVESSYRSLVSESSERISRLERSNETFADRFLRLLGESSERIGKIEHAHDGLDHNTKEALSEIRSSIAQSNAILSEAIWALSVGSDIREVRMNRNIPVRCYLADATVMAEVGDKLIDAIFNSLSELGIEKAVDLPPESGSWWKQLWGRTKEALSQDEVIERLSKLEHAASIKLIDMPQADVTKANAEAASKMIKALDSVQSASVQIGNLLIVKFTPKKGDARLIIRTLTSAELIALENNKAILKVPGKVMEMLDKKCASN